MNERALRGISCICALGVTWSGGHADLDVGGLGCDDWGCQYLNVYSVRGYGKLTFLASNFEYSFPSAKNILNSCLHVSSKVPCSKSTASPGEGVSLICSPTLIMCFGTSRLSFSLVMARS